MLHLGMQVLMLNCGLQQILAGDLTQGGLLSFLLYQEGMGRYVQVSQEPGHSLYPPCFSLWPLGLGLYLHPLKIQNQTKPQLIVVWRISNIRKEKKKINYNEPAYTHHLLYSYQLMAAAFQRYPHPYDFEANLRHSFICKCLRAYL